MREPVEHTTSSPLESTAMRISLVLGTLAVGGTERQVVRLALELQDLGHDVEVLCIASGGPLSARLERAGVPWQAFGWVGLWWRGPDGRRRPSVAWAQIRKLFALRRHLRRRRPDVCHTFLFWGNAIGIPVAFLARVPVRVSGRRSLVRDEFHFSRSLSRWLVTRLVNGLSKAIVANAQMIARDVIQSEHPRAGKVRAITNGVDIPPSRSDPGVEPPVGVTVANFRAIKGHEDLLHALALIVEPPRVCLVGDGDDRPRMESLARELRVAGTVEFLGALADLSPVYLQAQFAVLSSLGEGLPNVVLEAMACGLPVIATDVGGTPELVEDGVTGFLVPPGEPAALAAALVRLAGDPDLRTRLGAAGRHRAEAFSWPACRDAHVRLYTSLLGSRARRRRQRASDAS